MCLLTVLAVVPGDGICVVQIVHSVALEHEQGMNT